MIYARLIWAIFTWLIYELLSGVLVVLGLLLVPLAIELGHCETSRITGKLIYTAPRALWLFGNDEDGYQPDWYRILNPTWSAWRRMFMWAAIRNPVSNLRFIKSLHPPQRADRVQWITRGAFTFVWQGLFSRLIYDGHRSWFAIGWKYEPIKEDATGWQSFGQGFGLRLKRKP